MISTLAKTESDGVQKEVMSWLRKQPDVFVLRVNANGLGNKGVSDCILCYKGLFIALEFKRDLTGSYGVTEPQKIRGRQIKRAGGQWFAVDNIEQVKEILAQIG